jgi:hypothetical protein
MYEVQSQNTILPKSPVDTSHPCAKHTGLSTFRLPNRNHSTFKRKASACWMSAQRRLKIRMTNWLVLFDLILQEINLYVRTKSNDIEAMKLMKARTTTACSHFLILSGKSKESDCLSSGGMSTMVRVDWPRTAPRKVSPQNAHQDHIEAIQKASNGEGKNRM